MEPPNKALKLPRPGFGPAAEPPRPNSTCAASRRLQIGTSQCGIRRAAIRAAARPWPRSLAPWPLGGQITVSVVARFHEAPRACTLPEAIPSRRAVSAYRSRPAILRRC